MNRVTLILGPAGYLDRLVALISLAQSEGRAPLVFPRATSPDREVVNVIEATQLRAIWRALPATAEVWLVERPEHLEDALSKLAHRLAHLETGGPRLTRSGSWRTWRSAFASAGREWQWRELLDVPPEQVALPGLGPILEGEPPAGSSS